MPEVNRSFLLGARYSRLVPDKCDMLLFCLVAFKTYQPSSADKPEDTESFQRQN